MACGGAAGISCGGAAAIDAPFPVVATPPMKDDMADPALVAAAAVSFPLRPPIADVMRRAADLSRADPVAPQSAIVG